MYLLWCLLAKRCAKMTGGVKIRTYYLYYARPCLKQLPIVYAFWPGCMEINLVSFFYFLSPFYFPFLFPLYYMSPLDVRNREA